ncbi:ubiquitin-like protein FUBI [Panthera tigris]|uniref:ubiquitin-like protein FUBI n=1 Tax=Panthera tigris TaxID=9694 RepID=UPI001C6F8B6A|nr:ubiquitin-like protein FUBI [Panthera tigris]XP_049485148.1 ubiquitin-like protein FUBI [Panthera uncia]
MQLFVCAWELYTSRSPDRRQTVAQIKAHVASLEGITSEDQVVLLAGMPLEDEATLDQCGLKALTTLEVAGHMLGGKVHGFLAHVGKVREQTSKVVKQEKKKTSRAKQWMQYNQSLVNVVPPFGKKGPMPTLKSIVILAFPNKAT